MLEETRPDHAIRSYYQITARPCHPEEKEQQKGEMRFFENIISLDFFLTFWLSYSIYSIIGSGTQQVSFMEKFCVKAVFQVDSFCISPMGAGGKPQIESATALSDTHRKFALNWDRIMSHYVKCV